MSRLYNILNKLISKVNDTETRIILNDSRGIVGAYKYGKVVTVLFTGVRTTSTTERTTLGTLPEGWRPNTVAYSANISGNVGYACVEPDGRVQIFRADQIGRVDTSVTYVAIR